MDFIFLSSISVNLNKKNQSLDVNNENDRLYNVTLHCRPLGFLPVLHCISNISLYCSRVMGSRIMDPMPNLLLLMATTPKRRLLLEATPHSNSSMALPMVNKHQVSG